jgi:GT2 family glycosyltransferase
MSKKPGSQRVAVVIPTWNGKELLAECLESLRALNAPPAQIIVVDDASTDGTTEMLARQFPEVHLIAMKENGGFCAAVNAGIAEADADWVFLLNNDMTLRPDCVSKLVAAGDEGADMLAPLILWRDEPNVIYSAGDMQRRNGRPESCGFLRKLDGFPMPKRIFGVCAGAGMYRREVFERIGAFDEKFNIYFSDSDINFRARLAGFSAALVADAVAFHVGSAHLSGRTWKRTRQCYINHMLLTLKNMPVPLMLKFAGGIAAEHIHQTRRVFSAMRAESGSARAARELFSAWLEMISLLPHALRYRRRIQRMRSISPRDLEDMLER